MAKYQLKEGIELHPYGETSSISNKNLTDEIAEHLLAKGKATVEDFEPVEDNQKVKPKK